MAIIPIKYSNEPTDKLETVASTDIIPLESGENFKWTTKENLLKEVALDIANHETRIQVLEDALLELAQIISEA